MLGDQNLKESPQTVDALLFALQNDTEMDVRKTVATVLTNAFKSTNFSLYQKQSWKKKLISIVETEKDPKLLLEMKATLSFLK